MRADPKRPLIALLLAFTACHAVADPAESGRPDAHPFRGLWMAEKVVDKGREIERAIGSTWDFNGEKVVVKPAQNRPPGQRPDGPLRTLEYGVEYDPAASPKTIDLEVRTSEGEEHRTLLGVYEVEGDTLRMCFAAKPGGERPATFEASEDLVLISLKRPAE